MVEASRGEKSIEVLGDTQQGCWAGTYGVDVAILGVSAGAGISRGSRDVANGGIWNDVVVSNGSVGDKGVKSLGGLSSVSVSFEEIAAAAAKAFHGLNKQEEDVVSSSNTWSSISSFLFLAG